MSKKSVLFQHPFSKKHTFSKAVSIKKLPLRQSNVVDGSISEDKPRGKQWNPGYMIKHHSISLYSKQMARLPYGISANEFQEDDDPSRRVFDFWQPLWSRYKLTWTQKPVKSRESPDLFHNWLIFFLCNHNLLALLCRFLLKNNLKKSE